MDGKVHVGLEDEDLERLGKKDVPVIKASRRDLAFVLSQRLIGATTVSGTMVAAHMAGIPIFATGGIGGVHRGAQTSMDISADLTELGRTPVTVVCAGAKSILDLPKTLEYLETQGVPVITYGTSTEFPAFFSPRSGLHAPWNLGTVEQVAALVHTNVQLGLQSGQVVAVPIPEENARDAVAIEQAIDVAVREAESKGVTGKASTPFLLKRVVELTGGASLAANIALVKNNAAVASQSKRQMHNVGGAVGSDGKAMPRERPLLVLGCSAADLTSQIAESSPSPSSAIKEVEKEGTSHPGSVTLSVGGVGQNIARAAHYLGANPYLLTVLGRDFFGDTIKAAMEEAGMTTTYTQRMEKPARTAVYSSMHRPNGSLVSAVADMCINDMVSVKQVAGTFAALHPRIVGLDGNFPVPVLASAIMLAKRQSACVVFEPTSAPKCTRIVSALSSIRTMAGITGLVQMVTPNTLELNEMARAAAAEGLVKSTRPSDATVSRHIAQHPMLNPEMLCDALTLSPMFPVQIITLGDKGVAVVSSTMPGHRERGEPFIIRHILPRKPARIVNSNGAGDSLVGTLLALLHRDQLTALAPDGAIRLQPRHLHLAVELAQRASVLSLESDTAVSNRLSPDLLDTMAPISPFNDGSTQ
ncbi:hypothetical protein EV175_001142 [Coemansia sp. RSA 1933]|nr:hypothetical protein EV175_001142 [Coemansia sp. RSA 1933]